LRDIGDLIRLTSGRGAYPAPAISKQGFLHGGINRFWRGGKIRLMGIL
jgi:hypothetical protein